MKKKAFSPDKRFHDLAMMMAKTADQKRQLQIYAAMENLRAVFPEWSKKHGLEKLDDYDEWEEIVQPESFAEDYYGLYYYSALGPAFRKKKLPKPEKFLTDGQQLKLITRYMNGKKNQPVN